MILTDKIGTLTENRMTVTRMALPSGRVEVGGEGLEIEGTFSRDGTSIALSDDKVLRRALEVGVLCNNAALERDDSEITAVGDPVEVALLVESCTQRSPCVINVAVF